MASIKVQCIQSHQTPAGVGKLDTFEAGQEYTIDEAAFAPNLFKRIDERKTTKKQEGDE